MKFPYDVATARAQGKKQCWSYIDCKTNHTLSYRVAQVLRKEEELGTSYDHSVREFRVCRDCSEKNIQVSSTATEKKYVNVTAVTGTSVLRCPVLPFFISCFLPRNKLMIDLLVLSLLVSQH